VTDRISSWLRVIELDLDDISDLWAL
jgi:hypothetical protein